MVAPTVSVATGFLSGARVVDGVPNLGVAFLACSTPAYKYKLFKFDSDLSMTVKPNCKLKYNFHGGSN